VGEHVKWVGTMRSACILLGRKRERNLSLRRAIHRGVLKWVMKMWTELD
jgi:hypothetical protein